MQPDRLLPPKVFADVIRHAPLVSIDLCIVREGQLLLCMRNNEPARGFFFTPGGRVFKDEPWKDALKRIATDEIGLKPPEVEPLLMGVWDHFYKNSIVDADTTTHYINLAHLIHVNIDFTPRLDCQHASYRWIEIANAKADDLIHPYVLEYVDWLLAR